MKNLEKALKALLLKRTEDNEEAINAIAEPVNKGCLDCMCDEALTAAISEFRDNCEQAGHSDVAEMLS